MRGGWKVLLFSRHARQHPKWDLGTPPGGSRRRLRKSRGWALWLAFFATFLAVPALDAGSALWRKNEGCRVWSVVDGDTIRAVCEDGGETIRLLGYDTPELHGRCFREKWLALRAMAKLHYALWTSSEARVWLQGKRDRYGRALGRLVLDEQDVSLRMIEAKLARPYGGGLRRGWCGPEP